MRQKTSLEAAYGRFPSTFIATVIFSSMVERMRSGQEKSLIEE